MSNLLNYTICSGLGFPIFSEKIDKSKIPNNCFGAFVSVKRHQKLNEWPEDIHGCIGDWKNDYKNLLNIFNNCNLRVKRIISKSFIEGVNLTNNYQNLETFFKIDINKKCFLFKQICL